ncbi:DUF1207 domain-containing protein [Alienimonas californiensis]|uniref:DUF1207 domain-containing protein n=1 Tax=Alienimonas californiensis TaxID=2527989 RepID=A0A517P9Q0_9PLAN|nr:DUF1207 domain-containing protein [Alienimonas californiensis]QDT16106.1 hypothetical protein CA12_22040 [Alienimonas californiensis]
MFARLARRLPSIALCAAAVCCAAAFGGRAEADETCTHGGAGGIHQQPGVNCPYCAADDDVWRWRVLPPSLLFKPYIAGVKAARMAGVLNRVDGGRMGETTLDGSLGARIGIIRLGQDGPDADGWQFDIEAAAFPRLNHDEEMDLDATDFRAGLPLSYRSGPTAISFGYDHISTHVGDEFFERNPDFERVNYSRDALLLGVRQDLSLELTVYGEAAYAFARDGGSDPWVFQFGAEYFDEISPASGGPVAAANVQLREEFELGGRFTTVVGWQFREPETGRLLRFAAQYDAGKSPYDELFGEDETAIGLGVFYDF